MGWVHARERGFSLQRGWDWIGWNSQGHKWHCLIGCPQRRFVLLSRFKLGIWEKSLMTESTTNKWAGYPNSGNQFWFVCPFMHQSMIIRINMLKYRCMPQNYLGCHAGDVLTIQHNLTILPSDQDLKYNLHGGTPYIYIFPWTDSAGFSWEFVVEWARFPIVFLYV